MLISLAVLAEQHGTDKVASIGHNYCPAYETLLGPRRGSIKKLLEVGILRGASLRMWRDWLPNAWVYGIDYDPEAVASVKREPRITAFLGNELDANQLQRIIEAIGPDIDVVIDDARHDSPSQITCCRAIMPLLNPDAVYVIEDAQQVRRIARGLPGYTCEVVALEKRLVDDCLIAVRKG